MSVPRVLMVCMGNICRSPAAEGLLRHHAALQGVRLITDSAGTHGYHVGQAPDPRSCQVARQHGFTIDALRARRLSAADALRFDHILVMDEQNLTDARLIIPSLHHARIKKILTYSPAAVAADVPDPYDGDARDFAAMMSLLTPAILGLLKTLA
jgi:protein-tyrosine phosphatase